MGSLYELKELAGIWYIEFRSEETEWQPDVTELTTIQSIELEALHEKHLDEMQLAMEAIANNNRR